MNTTKTEWYHIKGQLVLVICRNFVATNSSPLILIMISFLICYVIVFSSLVIDVCYMYIFQGWVLLSIALGLKGHVQVSLNPNLMFFFVNDCFKAWFTHLIRVILFGSIWLLLDIIASLTFLNVVLNGSRNKMVVKHVMCGMVNDCHAHPKLTNAHWWKIIHLKQTYWRKIEFLGQEKNLPSFFLH